MELQDNDKLQKHKHRHCHSNFNEIITGQEKEINKRKLVLSLFNLPVFEINFVNSEHTKEGGLKQSDQPDRQTKHQKEIIKYNRKKNTQESRYSRLLKINMELTIGSNFATAKKPIKSYLDSLNVEDICHDISKRARMASKYQNVQLFQTRSESPDVDITGNNAEFAEKRRPHCSTGCTSIERVEGECQVSYKAQCVCPENKVMQKSSSERYKGENKQRTEEKDKINLNQREHEEIRRNPNGEAARKYRERLKDDQEEIRRNPNGEVAKRYEEQNRMDEEELKRDPNSETSRRIKEKQKLIEEIRRNSKSDNVPKRKEDMKKHSRKYRDEEDNLLREADIRELEEIRRDPNGEAARRYKEKLKEEQDEIKRNPNGEAARRYREQINRENAEIKKDPYGETAQRIRERRDLEEKLLKKQQSDRVHDKPWRITKDEEEEIRRNPNGEAAHRYKEKLKKEQDEIKRNPNGEAAQRYREQMKQEDEEIKINPNGEAAQRIRERRDLEEKLSRKQQTERAHEEALRHKKEEEEEIRRNPNGEAARRYKAKLREEQDEIKRNPNGEAARRYREQMKRDDEEIKRNPNGEAAQRIRERRDLEERLFKKQQADRAQDEAWRLTKDEEEEIRRNPNGEAARRYKEILRKEQDEIKRNPNSEAARRYREQMKREDEEIKRNPNGEAAKRIRERRDFEEKLSKKQQTERAIDEVWRLTNEEEEQIKRNPNGEAARRYKEKLKEEQEEISRNPNGETAQRYREQLKREDEEIKRNPNGEAAKRIREMRDFEEKLSKKHQSEIKAYDKAYRLTKEEEKEIRKNINGEAARRYQKILREEQEEITRNPNGETARRYNERIREEQEEIKRNPNGEATQRILERRDLEEKLLKRQQSEMPHDKAWRLTKEEEEEIRRNPNGEAARRYQQKLREEQEEITKYPNGESARRYREQVKREDEEIKRNPNGEDAQRIRERRDLEEKLSKKQQTLKAHDEAWRLTKEEEEQIRRNPNGEAARRYKESLREEQEEMKRNPNGEATQRHREQMKREDDEIKRDPYGETAQRIREKRDLEEKLSKDQQSEIGHDKSLRLTKEDEEEIRKNPNGEASRRYQQRLREEQEEITRNPNGEVARRYREQIKRDDEEIKRNPNGEDARKIIERRELEENLLKKQQSDRAHDEAWRLKKEGEEEIRKNPNDEAARRKREQNKEVGEAITRTPNDEAAQRTHKKNDLDVKSFNGTEKQDKLEKSGQSEDGDETRGNVWKDSEPTLNKLTAEEIKKNLIQQLELIKESNERWKFPQFRSLYYPPQAYPECIDVGDCFGGFNLLKNLDGRGDTEIKRIMEEQEEIRRNPNGEVAKQYEEQRKKDAEEIENNPNSEAAKKIIERQKIEEEIGKNANGFGSKYFFLAGAMFLGYLIKNHKNFLHNHEIINKTYDGFSPSSETGPDTLNIHTQIINALASIGYTKREILKGFGLGFLLLSAIGYLLMKLFQVYRDKPMRKKEKLIDEQEDEKIILKSEAAEQYEKQTNKNVEEIENNLNREDARMIQEKRQLENVILKNMIDDAKSGKSNGIHYRYLLSAGVAFLGYLIRKYKRFLPFRTPHSENGNIHTQIENNHAEIQNNYLEILKYLGLPLLLFVISSYLLRKNDEENKSTYSLLEKENEEIAQNPYGAAALAEIERNPHGELAEKYLQRLMEEQRKMRRNPEGEFAKQYKERLEEEEEELQTNPNSEYANKIKKRRRIEQEILAKTNRSGNLRKLYLLAAGVPFLGYLIKNYEKFLPFGAEKGNIYSQIKNNEGEKENTYLEILKGYLFGKDNETPSSNYSLLSKEEEEEIRRKKYRGFSMKKNSQQAQKYLQQLMEEQREIAQREIAQRENAQQNKEQSEKEEGQHQYNPNSEADRLGYWFLLSASVPFLGYLIKKYERFLPFRTFHSIQIENNQSEIKNNYLEILKDLGLPLLSLSVAGFLLGKYYEKPARKNSLLDKEEEIRSSLHSIVALRQKIKPNGELSPQYLQKIMEDQMEIIGNPDGEIAKQYKEQIEKEEKELKFNPKSELVEEIKVRRQIEKEIQEITNVDKKTGEANRLGYWYLLLAGVPFVGYPIKKYSEAVPYVSPNTNTGKVLGLEIVLSSIAGYLLKKYYEKPTHRYSLLENEIRQNPYGAAALEEVAENYLKRLMEEQKKMTINPDGKVAKQYKERMENEEKEIKRDPNSEAARQIQERHQMEKDILKNTIDDLKGKDSPKPEQRYKKRIQKIIEYIRRNYIPEIKRNPKGELAQCYLEGLMEEYREFTRNPDGEVAKRLKKRRENEEKEIKRNPNSEAAQKIQEKRQMEIDILENTIDDLKRKYSSKPEQRYQEQIQKIIEYIRGNYICEVKRNQNGALAKYFLQGLKEEQKEIIRNPKGQVAKQYKERMEKEDDKIKMDPNSEDAHTIQERRQMEKDFLKKPEQRYQERIQKIIEYIRRNYIPIVKKPIPFICKDEHELKRRPNDKKGDYEIGSSVDLKEKKRLSRSKRSRVLLHSTKNISLEQLDAMPESPHKFRIDEMKFKEETNAVSSELHKWRSAYNIRNSFSNTSDLIFREKKQSARYMQDYVTEVKDYLNEEFSKTRSPKSEVKFAQALEPDSKDKETKISTSSIKKAHSENIQFVKFSSGTLYSYSEKHNEPQNNQIKHVVRPGSSGDKSRRHTKNLQQSDTVILGGLSEDKYNELRKIMSKVKHDSEADRPTDDEEKSSDDRSAKISNFRSRYSSIFSRLSSRSSFWLKYDKHFLEGMQKFKEESRMKYEVDQSSNSNIESRSSMVEKKNFENMNQSIEMLFDKRRVSKQLINYKLAGKRKNRHKMQSCLSKIKTNFLHYGTKGKDTNKYRDKKISYTKFLCLLKADIKKKYQHRFEEQKDENNNEIEKPCSFCKDMDSLKSNSFYKTRSISEDLNSLNSNQGNSEDSFQEDYKLSSSSKEPDPSMGTRVHFEDNNTEGELNSNNNSNHLEDTNESFKKNLNAIKYQRFDINENSDELTIIIPGTRALQANNSSYLHHSNDLELRNYERRISDLPLSKQQAKNLIMDSLTWKNDRSETHTRNERGKGFAEDYKAAVSAHVNHSGDKKPNVFKRSVQLEAQHYLENLKTSKSNQSFIPADNSSTKVSELDEKISGMSSSVDNESNISIKSKKKQEDEKSVSFSSDVSTVNRPPQVIRPPHDRRYSTSSAVDRPPYDPRFSISSAVDSLPHNERQSVTKNDRPPYDRRFSTSSMVDRPSYDRRFSTSSEVDRPAYDSRSSFSSAVDDDEYIKKQQSVKSKVARPQNDRRNHLGMAVNRPPYDPRYSTSSLVDRPDFDPRFSSSSLVDRPPYDRRSSTSSTVDWPQDEEDRPVQSCNKGCKIRRPKLAKPPNEGQHVGTRVNRPLYDRRYSTSSEVDRPEYDSRFSVSSAVDDDKYILKQQSVKSNIARSQNDKGIQRQPGIVVNRPPYDPRYSTSSLVDRPPFDSRFSTSSSVDRKQYDRRYSTSSSVDEKQSCVDKKQSFDLDGSLKRKRKATKKLNKFGGLNQDDFDRLKIYLMGSQNSFDDESDGMSLSSYHNESSRGEMPLSLCDNESSNRGMTLSEYTKYDLCGQLESSNPNQVNQMINKDDLSHLPDDNLAVDKFHHSAFDKIEEIKPFPELSNTEKSYTRESTNISVPCVEIDSLTKYQPLPENDEAEMKSTEIVNNDYDNLAIDGFNNSTSDKTEEIKPFSELSNTEKSYTPESTNISVPCIELLSPKKYQDLQESEAKMKSTEIVNNEVLDESRPENFSEKPFDKVKSPKSKATIANSFWAFFKIPNESTAGKEDKKPTPIRNIGEIRKCISPSFGEIRGSI